MAPAPEAEAEARGQEEDEEAEEGPLIEEVDDEDDEGQLAEPLEAEDHADEFRGTPLEQRIRSFEKDRDDGMAAYKAGDYHKAVEHWSMARGSLKYVVDKDLLKHDPEALAKVKEDHYKMHLNLAQGFIKTEEWRQCIEYAERALQHDPKSEKALYRTCLALKEASRYSEAKKWIARLLEAHPGNAAGKQLLQDIARLEEKAKKTAKKSASKIFDGMRDDHDHRLPRTWLETFKHAPEDIRTELRAIGKDIRQALRDLKNEVYKWYEQEKRDCLRGCQRRKKD